MIPEAKPKLNDDVQLRIMKKMSRNVRLILALGCDRRE
jgi:hypothetical protein